MPTATRRIFFSQVINRYMYAASSAIVMNDYDKEPLPLTTQKWLKKTSKKKREVAGKRVSENFESFYVKRLDEYALANQESASKPPASLYKGSGEKAVVYPESGDKFTVNEIQKLIGSEKLNVYPVGTAYKLIVDVSGSNKPVNVIGSLLLGNLPETKGVTVIGNCILIPNHLLPK